MWNVFLAILQKHIFISHLSSFALCEEAGWCTLGSLKATFCFSSIFADNPIPVLGGVHRRQLFPGEGTDKVSCCGSGEGGHMDIARPLVAWATSLGDFSSPPHLKGFTRVPTVLILAIPKRDCLILSGTRSLQTYPMQRLPSQAALRNQYNSSHLFQSNHLKGLMTSGQLFF